MLKSCRILNKENNLNYYGEIDTELEGQSFYNLIEITDDENEYIWDNSSVIIKPDDLEELKTNAHNINKEKHLAFQAIPFIVSLTRDNNSTLNMILDCTDNTSDNLLRASVIAKKQGTVIFYDALGNGSDVQFSINEMSIIYNAFINRLEPSFLIKGQTKLAINNATTKAEIDNILLNLSYI